MICIAIKSENSSHPIRVIEESRYQELADRIAYIYAWKLKEHARRCWNASESWLSGLAFDLNTPKGNAMDPARSFTGRKHIVSRQVY